MRLQQDTSLNEYQLRNKDVEFCGKYFDIVPDGNLYTLDDYPIFAIRMRPMGISHIMERYKKKYGIQVKVLNYKINTNQYTLYSSDAKYLYNSNKEAVLKYFDFSECKNNQLKGIIIVITNNDDRMIHAIPYLYGIIEGRKKIIFLDAFFSPDLGSGCIIGANFFYNNYNGDIDCYCHGDNIQADHHSCGIIACDFVKNCLKDKYKLAKKIIKSVNIKTEIKDYNTGTISRVNIFELPIELKKFSQINQSKVHTQFKEDENNKQRHFNLHKWWFNHIHMLKYRKDPEPYDPDGSVLPINDGQVKSINTALLEKGHKYAGIIVEDLKEKVDYNYKYWLSLIKEQKDRQNFFRRLLKITRRLFKKD